MEVVSFGLGSKIGGRECYFEIFTFDCLVLGVRLVERDSWRNGWGVIVKLWESIRKGFV